jgi:phosphoribosyl 1,2-cyclic phosphate phosphodiesterase
VTRLTFLGTGTSQGIPVISCRCWVCTSDDSRDRRLRSSVLVETGGVRMVIDTGPDFRQQMLRAGIDRLDAILLTHEHKDHIGGIDDVRAFNHTAGRPMDIYATPQVQAVVRKDYDYAFGDANGGGRYPGAPEINLINISPDRPFLAAGADGAGVEVIPILGGHYRIPVLGFRIGRTAYLTDFNRIDDGQIEKLRGVEILVVNALRREHHVSHFTLDEALHVAWLVGAKRTYLTHVSHQMGRHAQIDVSLPTGVRFAYDGLTAEAG